MHIAKPAGRAEGLEAYQGPKLPHTLPEIFIQQAMANDDERLWVPNGDRIWSRPLCYNTSQGYWVHLSRYRRPGVITRHRHPGPVHGFVLKGRWHYLEHDWMAEAGSYVYEPPGDIHTLVVPEGVEEAITLFHNTSCIINCDPAGNVTGFVDVFTRIELARKHFEAVGLGADYVKQFIR